MTTQKINLSIIPGGINPIVNVSQYDKGQTFEFSLFEGSVPFVIPAGSSITIQGTKKDGTGFQYACTYLGNVVEAEETEQMTVFAGDVVTEIRVTNGDDMIASANFIIRVEAAALRSDIPISETELPLLERAVEAADEAALSAEDAEAYAVGTRGGVPVGPDDPAYENNAEYYATQPHVTSFKGRDGAVDPEAGDYDADQIDYDNTDSGLSATDVQGAIDELAGATYDADQIDYDNTDSGLTATDVQSAIDELAGADKVESFNGRNGAVVPDDGDYEIGQITPTGGSEGDIPVVNGSGKLVMANPIMDVYEVMGKMGAKNLNKYPYQETTQTDHDITWTVNSDGSVTANGTATADSTLICSSRALRQLILPNGKYILTGCPIGGGLSKYYIGAGRTYNGNFDGLGNDVGSGAELTLNGDDTDPDTVGLQIIIQIKSGQNVSNLTFKPMLRLASDTDDTYQPYAKTNLELTEDVGHWTTVVNSLVGDTTATFTDAMIKTTSVVDVYSENANGDITAIDGVTVTNGQAVVRFPALTVATAFKLWIR